jgi:phage baseplate assembly protein W
VPAKAAVRDFEPRVDLLEVRAEPNTAEPGTMPEASSVGREEARVTVSISYKVRRTNSRFNLVFPFYLGTVEIV